MKGLPKRCALSMYNACLGKLCAVIQALRGNVVATGEPSGDRVLVIETRARAELRLSRLRCKYR